MYLRPQKCVACNSTLKKGIQYIISSRRTIYGFAEIPLLHERGSILQKMGSPNRSAEWFPMFSKLTQDTVPRYWYTGWGGGGGMGLGMLMTPVLVFACSSPPPPR